jgi:hypothetical protein
MRGHYKNILVRLAICCALALFLCASTPCMLDTHYSKRWIILWFDATALHTYHPSFSPLNPCLQDAAAASIASQPEILLAVEGGNRAQVFCHLMVDPFAVFDEDPW